MCSFFIRNIFNIIIQAYINMYLLHVGNDMLYWHCQFIYAYVEGLTIVTKCMMYKNLMIYLNIHN